MRCKISRARSLYGQDLSVADVVDVDASTGETELGIAFRRFDRWLLDPTQRWKRHNIAVGSDGQKQIFFICGR